LSTLHNFIATLLCSVRSISSEKINLYAVERSLIPLSSLFPFYLSLQNKKISDRVDAAYTLEVVKVIPVRENPVTSDTEPAGARVDDDIKESSPESVEVEECEEEDEGNWLQLAELL
jgi:hypothetical protein